MLAIAGGIILGVIGLLAILWLVGAVIENQEEVAQGCAFIVGLLVIIGIGAWLDSEWPEINWIKTAFAAIGCLFAALMAFAFFHDSPLLLKMTGKERPHSSSENNKRSKIMTMKDIFHDINAKYSDDVKIDVKFFPESNRIVIYKDNHFTVFYKSNSHFIIFDGRGLSRTFDYKDEAVKYLTKFVLD